MDQPPVFKVGLVLWRAPGEVCLVQVKAKDAAQQAQVDFGLPKGTRRYLQDGVWVDARDAATAAAHANALEPLEITARTEAAEEIGLSDAAFDSGALNVVGPRPFQSRKGERYAIYWFNMQAAPELVLGHAPDAHEVCWFTREQVRTLRMNEGYRAVIDEVLESHS